MLGRLTKLLRRIALLLVVIIAGLLAFRIYDTQRGPPLEPWHTYVPHELTAKAIDHANWADYLKVEDQIFADVKHHVSQKLDADERIPVNRYFEGSPVYSQRRVPAGTFASAIANADGQASLFQPASTVQ